MDSGTLACIVKSYLPLPPAPSLGRIIGKVYIGITIPFSVVLKYRLCSAVIFAIIFHAYGKRH